MSKVHTKILLTTLVFLALFSDVAIYAQQANKPAEKKYIFLLDITRSMFGCCGANNIFPKVRDHLISAIESIPDSRTEIVVSTYQENIINSWTVKATSAGKKELINHLKKIDSAKVPGQNTDLLLAWNEVKRHLDKDKINIGFILTDGDHNARAVPVQKLYDEIPKWKEISAKQQAYIFLVDLVSTADGKSFAIDKKIEQKVRNTPNAQIINGIEFFILEIKEPFQILNIEDDLTFDLDLIKDNWNSKYDNLSFQLVTDHAYFDIMPKQFTFSDLPLKVQLVNKTSLQQIKTILDPVSAMEIRIDYPEASYSQIKLLNNTIKIQLNNKKEKVLRIRVNK